MSADTKSGHARSWISIHDVTGSSPLTRLLCLCGLGSGGVGAGLCRILHPNFREILFYEVG